MAGVLEGESGKAPGCLARKSLVYLVWTLIVVNGSPVRLL